MKEKFELSAWGKRFTALLKKNRAVLLVILAGGLLLALPPLGSRETVREETPLPGATREENELSAEAMEERLSKALSKIDGAGEVTVVLSVKGGVRQVLAQDGRQTQGERTESTVVVSKGSSGEDAVVLQQLSPEYRGALVICPGGDDPAVRLSLTKAVEALTGLGAARITVCKAK